MRVKYCCDAKAYENYYLSQVGHGMPYFAGARVQQGYGLGNLFSSIAKSVLPLVKKGAKTLGKQVLQSACSCSLAPSNGHQRKNHYILLLTIVAAVLCAAEYRNRSCSDDLFVNQALNAVLLLVFTKQFFSHYPFDPSHV